MWPPMAPCGWSMDEGPGAGDQLGWGWERATPHGSPWALARPWVRSEREA